MARATTHLCSVPLCANLVEGGPGRCAEHKGKARSGPMRDAYGWRWTRIRNAYLKAHPRCERCGSDGPWLDVHHRDGRRPDDPGANDWSNLETLDRACHRAVTEAERKARRERERLASLRRRTGP